MEIVRQLFRAHEYWRMKQLAVDLVILNERPPSYAQDLQSGIEAAARISQARPGEGVGGKVFILRSDLVSVDARTAAPVGGAGGPAQPARQRRRAGEAPAGGGAQYGAARPPPGLLPRGGGDAAAARAGAFQRAGRLQPPTDGNM